jgi:adenylosuccinate lyase
VEIATTLSILTGTISKIAKDVSLMMQTEIDEVFEPLGDGKGVHQQCHTSGIQLEITNGLIYAALVSLALSKFIRKNETYQFVKKSCQEAVKQGVHLKEYMKKQEIIKKYLPQNKLGELFK